MFEKNKIKFSEKIYEFFEETLLYGKLLPRVIA